MASKILTPRQKLINMMYLVLLALLAMNIDVNFIDTFQDLNASIQNSNEQFIEERRHKLNKIEEAIAVDSFLFHTFQDNATKVIYTIDSAISYIDDLERRILNKGGGYSKYGYPKNATNSLIPSRILLEKNAADTLHLLLIETVKQLESIIDSSDKKIVSDVVRIDKEITNFFGKQITWKSYHFNNIAQGAVLATLNRFKNNLLIIESHILSNYENRIFNLLTSGLSSFDVTDSLWMDVNIMNAHQFRVGEQIFIIPSLPQIYNDNLNNITTTISDQYGNTVQKGVVTDDGYIISYLASDPGTYTVTTDVSQEGKSIYKATRELKIVEQEIVVNYIINEYIKLDGYSSLFIGVKNPIIIEHPKFDLKDLKITIDNGRLSKFKNNIAIIPERLGVCSVELNDPSGELISSASFIVKHLPDPYPFINNQYQNEVSSKIFRVLTGISAGIEGFEWNDSFEITSFNTKKIDRNGRVVVDNKSFGPYFEYETLKHIRNAKKGETFIFDNILVNSADGRNRVITGLVVKII